MASCIAVGMSGGVDSSVAALLLRDAGHDVIGVTMRIYSGPATDRPAADSCYGPGEKEDIAEAVRVCARLGIEHRTIDLRGEYRDLVLDYARREYLAGRTPNPCVLCNQRVKFGALLDRLLSPGVAGVERFATGHYCRLARLEPGGRLAIRMAADPMKDQSYFLCMLKQEQLARVVFPLGDLTKSQVRLRAREAGLGNHDRPESQDFSSEGYRAAIGVPDREGLITDVDGRVIGSHRGVWKYTVGQRRGLGVGGGQPLYVSRIDAATNTVVAGPEQALYRNELLAQDVNWAAIDPPSEPIRLSVKIRYRTPSAPALVTAQAGGSARVVFEEPQRAIAPGQWAVFYDGEILVGGGAIAG